MPQSPRRHLVPALALIAVLSLVSAACTNDDPSETSAADDATSIDELQLNQIQMVGSHNSYKLRPRDEISEALSALAPSLFAEIDYGHLSLTEQLEDHGVRQLEIDVLPDPNGGLYATPAALDILEIDEVPDPELTNPGFKVQHIQDIDYNTTCLTFVACLEEIEQWSTANPDHLPTMIMVETKSDSIADGAEGLGVDLSSFDVDFATPPEMTPELYEDLEAEVLSVFGEDQIITPDDVRGDAESVEAAILDSGWPTIGESRGKVMFSLVDTGDAKDVYTADAPGLEGKLFFTSDTPGEPDAAFVRVDDSTEAPEDLQAWAEAGYLIRTRTDVPGVHAVDDDTTLRDSALASGGHYLSTDYYYVDPQIGTGYVVQLPGGVVARCNPVSAPDDCDDELFARAE